MSPVLVSGKIHRVLQVNRRQVNEKRDGTDGNMPNILPVDVRRHRVAGPRRAGTTLCVLDVATCRDRGWPAMVRLDLAP